MKRPRLRSLIPQLTGGVAAGGVELVLFEAPPDGSVDLRVDTTPPAGLHDAIVAGFLTGDVSVLEPRYHPDALLDANVPEWRFQQRGRDAILHALADEEFDKPDRRVRFLRPTVTSEGLLLETETCFTDNDELRVCREAHNLRIRDDLITEHVLWCTGIADAETSRSQFETAPMERM